MGEGAVSGLRVGHVIAGRYVIEKMVGRGGMGEVYAARDLKLRRRVAIKTLRDSGSGQRLRREAETVAQLGHPGIVSIFDVIEERGDWILVMELVEGVSLRKRLASGPLPPPEVARLVEQAASALSAAHAQGLVHRDVKPDNLIVRNDGRLALLDFGIAKVLEKLDSSAITQSPEVLTDTGAVVGTPLYLPPEQAHGESVSPASDQFSLAVVAYELLAGGVPWPVGNMTRLIAAIMQDAPRALPERLTALDPLFARALAKKPADRFPSVKEFSDQLSAALASVGPEPLPMPPQLATTLPPVSDPLADSSARTHRTTARTPTVTLRRLLTIGAPVALLAMAAVAAIMLRPHSSAPTGPRAFRLADLEPSRTLPAAQVEWGRALHHLSDGEEAMAREALEKAIAADPDFASAHLQRLVDETSYCPTRLEIARPHFYAARRASDTLSPRDRELLDALEPAVLDPPDLREVAARLRALTVRRPGDAQIWDSLSIAENKLFHFAASAEAAIKAASLDPGDALTGQLTLAQAQETMEDHNRVTRSCLKAFPSAEYCRSELALGLTLTGACTEMETVARELRARAPGAPRGPLYLAASLAGQNASVEAISMALAGAPPLMAPQSRARGEWQNQVSMAMWSGDFTEAIKLIDAQTELDPIFAAMRKVDALVEIGDKRGAGQAALAYLKRAPALPRFERPESDPLPLMAARARAGEEITEADYVARREGWINSWRARIDDQAWPAASPVIGGLALSYPLTAEEARASVARLDTFGGPPPIASRRFWTHDGPPGELLRQGGRLDEALPRLRAEAERCSFDVDRVRARLGLGLALEEKHDVPGACASYAAVVAQWGGAKPRSVTAEAAKARIKALGCN
jgi:serine/threonine-protein kinase